MQSTGSMVSIPRSLFGTVKAPSGKTDSNGIVVLAEVMYLSERSETGKDGMFHVTYQQLADGTGLSRNQVLFAMNRLVAAGLLNREFRVVEENGKWRPNMMFVGVPGDHGKKSDIQDGKESDIKDEGTADVEAAAQEHLVAVASPVSLCMSEDFNQQENSDIRDFSDTVHISYSYNNNNEQDNGKTEPNRAREDSEIFHRGVREDSRTCHARRSQSKGRRSVREAYLSDPGYGESVGRSDIRPVYDRVFDMVSPGSNGYQDRETQWMFAARELCSLEEKAKSLGFGADRVFEAIREVHGRMGTCGKLVSFWLKDFGDLVEAQLSQPRELTWSELARELEQSRSKGWQAC